MNKTKKILAISGVIFAILIAFLLIKHNRPSFMSGRKVIYLDSSSFTTANVKIGKYITREEYYANHTKPVDTEKVEHRIVNGKVVEVVYLGDIGVLGEKLDISYIDTETNLNEDRYNEYMAELENSSSNQNSNNGDSGEDNTSQDDNSSDNGDNGENTGSDDDNSDDNQNTDNDQNTNENDNNSTDEQNSNTENNNGNNEIIRSDAVREYVSPENSCQRLGYVIYAPENVTSSTPVFLYLHGIGQNGASYKSFIGALSFIKYLINGNWAPDVIIVAPILPGGTKWINETSNLKALLTEVTNTFGGNMNNLYIGGFSAGCDSITPIAKEINFKGALYMAGYLGGVGNTVSTDEFLRLWSGKSVYYFRDSLYSGGGYGYQAGYVNTCVSSAAAYNVHFEHIDMNWVHKSTMVDAVLLPTYFTDLNGNNCRDTLRILIP